MKMRVSLIPALLLSLLVMVSARAASVVGTPAELAEARRWSAAKFEGVQRTAAAEPALVVLANHGPVQKNSRGGRPMHIVDKDYTRGLYCHAPSKITVRLPGPGVRFTAIAGVDSNDQTSGGRGSVDFSVHVGAAEKFRSGVMREGMPGRPVLVDLKGAAEFVLQIEETPDGIVCDQADWVDARITLKDGAEFWLADLPLREAAQAPLSTEPPFSFVYGGKPSAELLKEWPCERSSRKLDENRAERTSVWIDPATGLQVRCVGIEYSDFPTVEWVVHFKNNSTQDTPILSDIQAVDLTLARSGQAEFILNHHAGDNCMPDSYEPKRLTLAPKSEHRFAPAGGRLPGPRRIENHAIIAAVNAVEKGASQRSSGRLPPPRISNVPAMVAASPGQGAVARTRPDRSTNCEMPELARRKSGSPYSVARTGAMRACNACWAWPQSAMSMVGTTRACAPSLTSRSATRV